jgi:hypothetical protein
VWGAHHVGNWLEFALPSWLAAGNLPALAANRELTVVILSGSDDRARIAAHPLAAGLAAFAAVHHLAIDDLITPAAPAVSLTLAFARGAAFAQQRRPQTRLAFLNADFVLADGSLATLATKIDEGAELVLAPSLRAIEETVRPQLETLRRPAELRVAPRDLVRLALAALHPTVLACRVDQPLLAPAHPNQLFWRADRDTLLARSMLLFPLALKPTRPIGPASSFFDYGFVDTVAPGATATVLGDSDDWFALELAPERQEERLLRVGKPEVDDIARSLAVWSTAFHRSQIGHAIVIHAADGRGAASARAEAERYVRAIRAACGPPVAPEWHPYWVGAVEPWRAGRRSLGLPDHAPELAVPPTTVPPPNRAVAPARASRWRRLGARLLLGSADRRALWHPDWAAEHLGATFARGNADRAIVVSGIDALDHLSEGALAREDDVIVLIGHAAGKEPQHLAARDLARILARLDAEFEIVAASLPVRPLDRRVQRWHADLASASRSGRARRAGLLIRSCGGLAAMFAGNAARLAWRLARGGDGAGLMIALRRRRGGS